MKTLLLILIATLSQSLSASEGSHGTRDGGDHTLTLPGVIQDQYEIRVLMHYLAFAPYSNPSPLPETYPTGFSRSRPAHYIELVYRVNPTQYTSLGPNGVAVLEGVALGDLHSTDLRRAAQRAHRTRLNFMQGLLNSSPIGLFEVPSIDLDPLVMGSRNRVHLTYESIIPSQVHSRSDTPISERLLSSHRHRRYRFYRINSSGRTRITGQELASKVLRDLTLARTLAEGGTLEGLLTAEHVYQTWLPVTPLIHVLGLHSSQFAILNTEELTSRIASVAREDYAPMLYLLRNAIVESNGERSCHVENWRNLHELLSAWHTNGICARLETASIALPESAVASRLLESCREKSAPFLRRYFETSAYVCNETSLHENPALLDRLRSILDAHRARNPK